MLKIREGSLNLPVYLKMADGVLGGEDPQEVGKTLWQYSAVLGDIPAFKCDLQGFTDRLYCIFTLGPKMPGKEYLFQLELESCELPVFSQMVVLPPPPQVSQDQSIGCHAELDEETCVAKGGQYIRVNDSLSLCFCP
jgi:hypothetical protein